MKKLFSMLLLVCIVIPLQIQAISMEAIKNDVVHLLGNLTLTPYNSGLGNSSFKSKLEYRDKKTLVGLNLNIFLNNSIDKDRPTWGKTSILERNKILTDSFIQKFKIDEN